jgi:hypothetical protein
MVPDSNFLPLRNDLWSEPYHLRPFLVKLEQGSKDFTFWCEGVGMKEAELLQPPSQNHANRRALSYSFKNQPPTCACKMPESFILGLSGARSKAI